MADDVTADPGTGGATFAADEIAGVYYPRTKVAWGVDGAAVDASATNPFPVVQTGGKSATATTSQVADTASSTIVLASNAARLGATIFNDSSATLYVKCGTTASATDYTVRLVSGAFYAVQFNYTGRIDGIWATDPNDGAARVTEFT